ncbi:MAG: hypothetical protein ACKVP7_19230 [Hyphomicrobiaceae bacterium]
MCQKITCRGSIVALVRESLDLGEISGDYTSPLGQPPSIRA